MNQVKELEAARDRLDDVNQKQHDHITELLQNCQKCEGLVENTTKETFRMLKKLIWVTQLSRRKVKNSAHFSTEMKAAKKLNLTMTKMDSTVKDMWITVVCLSKHIMSAVSAGSKLDNGYIILHLFASLLKNTNISTEMILKNRMMMTIKILWLPVPLALRKKEKLINWRKNSQRSRKLS